MSNRSLSCRMKRRRCQDAVPSSDCPHYKLAVRRTVTRVNKPERLATDSRYRRASATQQHAQQHQLLPDWCAGHRRCEAAGSARGRTARAPSCALLTVCEPHDAKCVGCGSSRRQLPLRWDAHCVTVTVTMNGSCPIRMLNKLTRGLPDLLSCCSPCLAGPLWLNER